jgi:hypothetical protein
VAKENLKGASRKLIQAGQDWSDPDTWKALAFVLVFFAAGLWLFATHDPVYTYTKMESLER